MPTRHLNYIPFDTHRDDKKPSLLIVVPCYNEREVLQSSAKTLLHTIEDINKHGKISDGSRILFVNDGSRDDTWDIIQELNRVDSRYIGISLAHNRGHQNALVAGLMFAIDEGYDITVSIDADLQDDVTVIEEMVEKYLNGAEIVYGVRNNRDTDTGFKRNTAMTYYKIMTKLGTETIPNSADFRLMSRRALIALSQYNESNLFLRGMVPSLGFKTDKVYYKRGERMAGESKYPLPKMINLAMDGITSFSMKPMDIILYTGCIMLLIALGVLIVSIIRTATGSLLFHDGFMAFSLWLIGGALMTSLGIVGEYTGKAYMETKHRPRYVISDKVGVKDKTDTEGNIGDGKNA